MTTTLDMALRRQSAPTTRNTTRISMTAAELQRIRLRRQHTVIVAGLLDPLYHWLEFVADNDAQPAENVQAWCCPIYDLTDDDAVLNGRGSAEELKSTIRDHYPGIRRDSRITIVQFRLQTTEGN